MITEKDVQNIAKLASIKILPEEVSFVSNEINSIIHWIDQLQEVDISDVQDVPTCSMPERDDVVTETSHTEAILANAPDTQEEWFAVPKMIK